MKRGLVCSAGTHIQLTHGYKFFLTVGRNIEPDVDIDIRQIPGGMYAVLRFKNLDNLGNAWEDLWYWIERTNMNTLECRKATMVGVVDSRSK